MLSKFLGCLLGVGVGDALGVCWEGRETARRGEIESLAEKLWQLTVSLNTLTRLNIKQEGDYVTVLDGVAFSLQPEESLVTSLR